jgi:hypothetical protein
VLARVGRQRRAHELLRDVVQARRAAARLRSARPQPRAGGLGRLGQRAVERQAAHQARPLRCQVLADDGAHRVAQPVRRCDAQTLAGLDRGLDEARDRQRAFDALRAPAARQIDAHDAVACERAHQGRPGVAAAAQAVHAHHGLALALAFDGDAVEQVQRHARHPSTPAGTCRPGQPAPVRRPALAAAHTCKRMRSLLVAPRATRESACRRVCLEFAS